MREELLQFAYPKLMYSADFQQAVNNLHLNEDILEVRRRFALRRPIRGIIRYLDGEDVRKGMVKLVDNQLTLLNISLSCEAIQSFSSCQIQSAMIYLITSGSNASQYNSDGEMNDYFAENICIDLVRKMLIQNFHLLTEEEFGKEKNIWYSDVLGPGYYNMPLDEGIKLHKLLKGERIGVTYKGELMVPLKSSIGIVFSYSAEQPVSLNPCSYCKLIHKDCTLCACFQ